jgi:hypothetical protein
MVAQVAADEPETAAKIVQPMMLVCSSRRAAREPRGEAAEHVLRQPRAEQDLAHPEEQRQRGEGPGGHEPQIVTAMASPARGGS